jgi:hypothetical protein
MSIDTNQQSDDSKINNEFEPYESAIRHKEIDLIQSVIIRMADNQFKVKGFCITILGFFLVLFTKSNASFYQCLIASLITIFGCYKLDFNFLQTEKLYRMWFEFLTNKRSETKAYLFELNPVNIKQILNDQKPQRIDFNPSTISKSTRKSWSFGFYWTLFIIIIIFYLPICFAAFSIHCPILPTI